MVEAKAQDLYDVIDPSYIPRDEVEHFIFWKKLFMTAIFRWILQIDKWKGIVKKYTKKFNAQKNYIELEGHPLTSAKAESETESILNYLITSRVDDCK